MGAQFDEAISLHALVKSAKRCCRGVGRKTSAQAWKLEPTARCEDLQHSIQTGKHRTGHGTPFKIYEPKERDILPPLFRERVFQNSMCVNGVYEDLTEDLIYDNGACQVGKGAEHAVRRTVCFLERAFRQEGHNNLIVRHLDVKKFFPSTPHSVSKDVLYTYVKDKAFLPYLEEVFDSFEDNRPIEIIYSDPFGIRGTGLGSPVSQLVQLSLLNKIDQTVIRMPEVFAYIRYMDDIVIICYTKEGSDKIADYIESECAKLGLSLTDKGGPTKVSKGFYFLKKKFILTSTGKVIVIPEHKKISKERRVLRELKRQLDSGEKTMQDVEAHYESFISGLMMLDCKSTILKLDKYYKEVFGVKPNYKCKYKSKRYKEMAKIHKTQKDIIRELRNENAQLKAGTAKNMADIDFIAMWTDTPLVTEEPETNPEVTPNE